MRPRFLLPIAVALLGAVTGCDLADGADDDGAADAPDPVPEVVRYTALGDSLATGAGADTSYVAAYADWLAGETGATVEVTNLAVDGWTSDDLLSALTTDERTRTAVEGAHVVTWSIGGNDLLAALSAFLQGGCGGDDGQACFREAVETASANGDAVVDELLELRDDDPAGLRTHDLYLPFMDDPRVAPYVDELRPYLDDLNDHVREHTTQRGIPVADVEPAFHGPDGDQDPVEQGLISDDGLHPSDRGHELIAGAIADLGLELGERPASDG